VLTAGKTFVLGYTNETDGAYTRYPVVIFDDFTTASKYVDFDFKAKSSAMKMLSARPGEADLRFVYERMQLINYPIFDHKRRWIGEFSKLEVEVPGLEEQTAIAEVADELTRYITSLERLITKKQAIKQGMMQELLGGKTRLPGCSRPWMSRPLGELARIKTGSRNNQDKIPNGRYPFFVRSATVERIDSYSYDCEAILIPGEGGIGSIFHYINGKFEVHQRVYKISDFLTGVVGRFIYHYMCQYFGSHAMENSVKATVDSLRLPTFRNFVVRLPDVDEQGRIASTLDDADREIELLHARLVKARDLKQGMMQELLTGRTRLPAQEAAA